MKLKAFGLDPHSFELLIFNRWGEIVFESYDADVGRDGSYGTVSDLVQDGMCIWKIEFKSKEDGERKVVNGLVNLIR